MSGTPTSENLLTSQKKSTRFGEEVQTKLLSPTQGREVIKTDKLIDQSAYQQSQKTYVDSEAVSNNYFDQTGNITTFKDAPWKPPKNISYETMALSNSTLNCKVRPCGFRSSGNMRQIKNTCMLSQVRLRCKLRKRNPKLAVCITMYNEDEEELKTTLTGCLQNYNCLRVDERHNFTKDDFLVVVVCDGYENIPASFKKFATKKQFFDENVLITKGFMEQKKDGTGWKMKSMKEIMDPQCKKVPSNILHLFQATTWDFGLQSDVLKGRRINFIWAIKQRNDGKINSHKWFFQGVCKFLKPEFCMLLDIGTRPDNQALVKLYQNMKNNDDCGGCAGEIEVDFPEGQTDRTNKSYFVETAQFYEYKLGHTPDKCTEAFFGFCSVLPGAYSLFRWDAIKGQPLDTFFKNVTSEKNPTCAEANEYLAEDRIMCLQIYIKESERYYLSYVPDAKAFTDAPPNLTVLLKQRRRWMNGSLFGTFQVLKEATNMCSFSRGRHPWYRQIGMIIFMIYMLCNYLFQFFIVGSMLATIVIFFAQLLKIVLSSSQNSVAQNLYNGNTFQDIIIYTYLSCLFLTALVSLTIPVNRSMTYFTFIFTFFSIMTLLALVGIIFFLVSLGFNPDQEQLDESTLRWEPIVDPTTGEDLTYFSYLVVAGVIVLSIYAIPIVFRPLDFLANIAPYTVGLLSYIVMLPVFSNVFQIYAMCNLHDVSWGNRPSSTGTEAFSANKQTQESIKTDYMIYRTNFFFLWFTSNGIYAYIMIRLVNGQYGTNSPGVIDGSVGPLEVFSLFIAGLVVFRVFFAFLYILLWKFRYCCLKKYKVKNIDLNKVFKHIKHNTKHGDSTDDEEIDEEDARIFGKVDDNNQITLAQAADSFAEDFKDSDDDQMEFEEADVEEAEDRLKKFKKKKGNAALNQHEIEVLSKGVSMQEMNPIVAQNLTQDGIDLDFSGAETIHVGGNQMILKNFENVRVPIRNSKQIDVQNVDAVSTGTERKLKSALKKASRSDSNNSDFMNFKSMNAPSTIYPHLQEQTQQDPNTSIQEDDTSEDGRGTILTDTDGSRQFFAPNGNQVKINQELMNSAPANVSPSIKKLQTQIESSLEVKNKNENSQDKNPNKDTSFTLAQAFNNAGSAQDKSLTKNSNEFVDNQMQESAKFPDQ